MKTRFRLPLIALVLAAPAGLAAQDFQLPPNPTPTASPRAQGPVDTEGSNVPAVPRVIATPTPTPTARPATVQPIPTATPTPVPSASATPARAQPSSQPTVTPRVQPSALPTGAERLPLDPGETAPIVPAPVPSETATRQPAAVPTSTAGETAAQEPASEEGIDWLWPALGGGLLLLLGLGYLISQRRRNAPPPEIERPVITAGGPVSPSDILVKADAIKLTRSLMNATLQYRVSLMNKATRALGNVVVGADIVSAHGGVPVEQQVASANQQLEKRHTFERIAPGQSVRYEGQITIPLSQVRAIRQSNAALFVPLLRLRVDGACEEPLVKTFVVGLGAPGGGRVTPFRLDEGPRSYEPIAARALD
ncbi:hypothetical protein [Qipengyuania sphaerica]|uniref:hypothetical protein n=1 Tax=Qipengyuania sphaerica TaxID=2867243 RepID=UPI001C87E479|nr:hypothetical protein [Qipengyuania sphaerica]MBX7541151.1 hypothetical protein [Qipengyuania sphaerica]